MDNAPFLDLPNGAKTPACHNNESMRAPNPNKPGRTNEAAKKTSPNAVMNAVNHARK